MEMLKEVEFGEKVLEAKGKVLVDFFAKWCGPCRMLEPLLDQIEQECDTPMYKVDTDECTELAKSYDVTSLPTVLVFEDGKVIATEVGIKPKPVYLELIKG